MNSDYLKKIYNFAKSKLALSMEKKNIEEIPDYSVYRLLGNEWVSLSGVEGIADRH